MLQRKNVRAVVWVIAFGLTFASVYLILSHSSPYKIVKMVYRRMRSKFGPAEPTPTFPPGMWVRGRDETKLSPEQREEMEKLAAIGYTSGYSPATSRTGVTIYDRNTAFDGLNFYTSGHAPEAILMNMKGEELHKWHLDFDQFSPDRRPTGLDRTTFWRRAHLFENGDILAIFEGLGLIKLNKDSKLLWGFQGGAHHDLDVLEDGTIYVLTRAPKILPSINPDHPVLEDFITVLDAQGKVKNNVSIVKAIESSAYAGIIRKTSMIGDIFHTNAIRFLDGSLESKAPFLKKGNVLISLCYTDTLAIVDMEQSKVVWALSGEWKRQHDPVLLSSGHLLLFDNEGPSQKRSRVLEMDILTGQIFWSYESPLFYSPILGSNKRLPNGNTLISESWFGRSFEVTPDHKIVWEFHNPHRAGSNQKFVAVLPDLERVPISQAGWLKR